MGRLQKKKLTRSSEVSGILPITTERARRQIDELGRSWSALRDSFPGNEYIESEIAAWVSWANKVITESLDDWIIGNLDDELGKWKLRYKKAYEQAVKENPEVKPTAPLPEVVIAKVATKTSPWVWAIVAASGAIGIYSIYKMTK